jgi:LuxR family transcriptional regulator, maltose regulon positive regulatory protein
MLRAFLMRVSPENALAGASLAVAAEQLGSPWRSNALALLGSARWVMGDVDAADAAFTEANDLERRSGRTHIVAVVGRASLAMARGDWDAAAELARDSHNAAERTYFGDIATGLLVHAVAARVASHRGDAQRSRQEFVHAQMVLPLVSYALPWASVTGLLELARTYLALGDTEGGEAMMSEAEGIIRHRPNLGVLIGDAANLRRQVNSAGRTVARHSALTPAELLVLPMLSTHLTFEEIGARLSVSLEPFPGLRLTARPTRD